VSDRFLVVLDSLVWAASDIRRTSDAVRDGLVGALDDEVAVGHDVLQGVLFEFGERWQLGLDCLLGGQNDIADGWTQARPRTPRATGRRRLPTSRR
jgi:hypothetical protein